MRSRFILSVTILALLLSVVGSAGSSQQQSSDQTGQQRPGPRNSAAPQPRQKQSLDYFIGQWKCKWMGRDSLFGLGGPRETVTTFKPAGDGKTLESRTTSTDGGDYQESAVISFDESTKTLTYSERRGDAQIISKGDWSTPISIRFTIDPITIKGQTLRLKRTISVISSTSFVMTEELSEDGGTFVRLGQGVFTKIDSTAVKN